MNVFVRVAPLIILCFLISGCKKDHSDLPNAPSLHNPNNLNAQQKQIISADQELALKLLEALNPQQLQQNIFISPFSISMALGMTLNSARANTYDEIRQTLGFEGLKQEEINQSYKNLMQQLITFDNLVFMELANAIFYRQNFSVKRSFLDINAKYFNARISPLDFALPAAVGTINQWASDHTHGKIEQILTAIPAETVMYLLNAIYFKGTWVYRFDERFTNEQPFFPDSTSKIPCDMMQITQQLPYLERSRLQMIDLPYGNGHYVMTLILPKYPLHVNTFIGQFNNQNIMNWFNQLSEDSVTLKFPKFKIQYDRSLKDVLMALGIRDAFHPQRANFTGIANSGGLYISKVKHSTFIEVNEEGTEAAGATLVEFSKTSAENSPKPFMLVNRPFLFIIRERSSNMVLFIGKIVRPQWSA
ncbi:MAG: serpin family protein [Caldithrix sp.]|nr:serpin family protein [Caldithrix sp.]